MNGRTLNEMKIQQANEEVLKTMPDYVKRWEKNMRASGTTATTRKNYIFVVKRLLTSINPNMKLISVDQITEEDVLNLLISTQYVEKGGETVRACNGYQVTYWFTLNNFFKYLKSVGLIERNFMETIKRPKNNDLQRINENRVLLKARDFVKILDAIENDDENNDWIRSRNMAVILLYEKNCS